MTDSKEKDKKTRLKYEPPRLFDLGTSVAHAQAACKTGGSPAGGACRDGSAATGGNCNLGGMAGGACRDGTAASGAQCRSGNAASGNCKAGGSPRSPLPASPLHSPSL
jgi:hypothetical protein